MKVLALTYKDSTDYLGNLILKNSHPSQYLFDGGYASFNADTLNGWHYYVQDYMGNNRMVVNAKANSIEQETHYYPYGGVIGDLSSNENLQPYKFEGKELDRTFGLDWYDIQARQYDAIGIPSCNAVDPLAEKYYGISPYAYCAGNPVNLVDPTGMSIVADSLSQFALEYSLPENERHLIHFDSSGNLTIDEADSPSEVLIDIQKLVASETLYDLRVSQTDMNGKPFVEDLDYYYRGSLVSR